MSDFPFARTALEKLPELATLKQKAYTFSDRYVEARKAMSEASRAHREMNDKLKLAEGQLVSVIAATANPDGKPKFSNAEARKVELAQRKEVDPEYVALAREVDRLDAVKSNAEQDLRAVEIDHKLYQTIVDLTLGEVALLVSMK